jgi:DNA-binding transcriptional LysR family regulator
MFEKGINKATNKNFSLARLHSLVQLKKAGYISKAANGDVTRGALISRQIGELEKFFGKVSLRKKNGNLQGLSPEGEELAIIAENFLTSMQGFQDKIDGIQPSINIGAGETFLTSVLLPNFSNLKKSSTGMRINLCNLRSSDLSKSLESGETDLIIVSEKRLGKNERKLSLGKLNYKLYAPLTWDNLSKYQKEPLAMICNKPYASLSGSGKRRSHLEQIADSKIGNIPNYELECSSLIEVLQAGKSNCFCGILPTFLAKDLPLKHYKHITIKELTEMHGKLAIAWKKETSHFKPEIQSVAKEIQLIFKKIS